MHLKIFATLLIAALHTPTFAIDPTPDAKPCIVLKIKESLISRFKKTPPSREELNRLSKITFSDLFPETEKIEFAGSGNTLERTKVDEEQIKAFQKQWDELLNQRKSLTRFDVYTLERAIKKSGGEKRYPKLTPEIIDTYKRSNLTMSDLQTNLVIEFMEKKYAKNGDYEGWRKYLAPQSPYTLAKLAVQKTKNFLFSVRGAVTTGFTFAIAQSFYKPAVDAYNKEFNHVTSKAMDQLPENKAYADSIEDNKKLENDTFAINFASFPTQEERLRKWEEIEEQFKKSHERILQNRSRVKAFTVESEQNKKIATPYLRANRITYLTSLSQLAKDTTPESLSIKALALASFKAQDMRIPPTLEETDLTKSITDQVLQQLSENAPAFQQFVIEFVRMQSEAPQS